MKIVAFALLALCLTPCVVQAGLVSSFTNGIGGLANGFLGSFDAILQIPDSSLSGSANVNGNLGSSTASKSESTTSSTTGSFDFSKLLQGMIPNSGSGTTSQTDSTASSTTGSTNGIFQTVFSSFNGIQKYVNTGDVNTPEVNGILTQLLSAFKSVQSMVTNPQWSSQISSLVSQLTTLQQNVSNKKADVSDIQAFVTYVHKAVTEVLSSGSISELLQMALKITGSLDIFDLLQMVQSIYSNSGLNLTTGIADILNMSVKLLTGQNLLASLISVE